MRTGFSGFSCEAYYFILHCNRNFTTDQFMRQSMRELVRLYPDPSEEYSLVLDATLPDHAKRTPEKRTPFERVALLLQGGGALGSYQGGVYQALAEAGLHPDWVAGISIGAINSAIIAGNPPHKRVERLRDFWETVSRSPLGIPYFKSIELKTVSSTRRSITPAP